MEINTQVITNSLDNTNKFCIDWNHLGCIAFASSNAINIIDSNDMKIRKTLISQKIAPICKLKWSVANLNSNYNIYPYLASAADDLVSIWDVSDSKVCTELNPNDSTQNKVIELKWTTNASSLTKNNNSNTLIVLYSNSKLIIWNCQSSTKIWSKSFNDQRINSFAIDPFDFLKLAFLGSNLIHFLKIDNLDSNLVEKSQKKFYLALNDPSTPVEPNSDSKRSSTVNLFTSYWKNMKPNEAKTSQSTQQKLLKECFQIEFHSYVKNLIFLVYPREIFIFDLTVNQTINFFQVEKIFSPFIQIYTCAQADIFYSLHENGSISVHGRSESLFQYNLIANTDQKRLPKNSHVFGFSVCPNTEKFLSVLLSDGRVLKYELYGKINRKNQENKKHLFLFELIEDKMILKLMLTSMLDSIPSNSLVIKMGPKLTRKNYKYWQPLLAMGDSSGFLSIFNLNKNHFVKKLTISTNPIMGIEWMNMNYVITWTYNPNFVNSSIESNPGFQNKQQILVKNEILLTDLRTGESVNFRPGQSEESPIISIKISNLRQYLVILFKENPLEIWDLKNFSLIKKISKKSPIITLLEWCPYDFNKKIDQKQSSIETKNSGDNIENNLENSNSEKESHVSEQKESLICIDSNSLMYSFAVECNHIKDGSIVLPEDGYLINITCCDLKKEVIIFGDMDGGLSRWNVRTKNLKTIQVRRGSEVKKVKYAPGKENMLLLVQYSDLLHIFEITNFELFSEYKSKLKILDSYWCSSDRILVYFSDLSIRVFDVNFKQVSDFGELLAPSLFNSNEKETNLFKLKSGLFEKLQTNDLLNTEKYSENLKILLEEKFNKDLFSKINQYAGLSAIINLNSFETKFWSLYSYLADENDNSTEKKFRAILGHNSYLLNTKDYRSNEIEALNFYRDKLDNNQQLNSVLKDFILSNQLDAAFNFLMDSETSNENYTNNLIKACLISSLNNSNENSQTKTSIKLAATNLIANGKIYDGVELLCMIGLVFDACRYLQDNNEWEKAAWVAKVRLNQDEQNDVMKRWSEYLCTNQINRKETSILLLLSCKAYWKVLDLLADTNYIQMTFLATELFIKNKMINLGDDFKLENKNFTECVLNQLDSIQNQQHRSIIKKIVNNYLDFKKLLNF